MVDGFRVFFIVKGSDMTSTIRAACVATTFAALGLVVTVAQADITPIGDVDPADPTTWTSSTRAYIGNFGAGSVTVDADSDLVSGYSYLGIRHFTGKIGRAHV